MHKYRKTYASLPIKKQKLPESFKQLLLKCEVKKII